MTPTETLRHAAVGNIGAIAGPYLAQIIQSPDDTQSNGSSLDVAEDDLAGG